MELELSREQILEMLPAYALGALEPEEMLAVEDYLARHDDLLPTLRAAEEAAAQLAYAAPPAPLPIDAKTRLFERVAADRQSEVVADRRPETVSAPATESLGSIILNWFRPFNAWTAIAGVATAALLVMFLYTIQGQFRANQRAAELADLRLTLSQLETTNQELQQTNQVLQQQLQNNQDRLTFISDMGLRQALQVPAKEDASNQNAIGILYVGSNQEALLQLDGLEPLPGDQTYQLWVVPEGETSAMSAGLIDLQADSTGWFPVSLPAGAETINVVGLSIEPAGGSPQAGPSGPVVLHTP
jgi:anti-sigma-K factor RskA